MSKKATEFQRKAMSWMYRGKEIFKPLNTGWIDENVACVREWVANIFFYRKGDTTIMIDAGYNYDRLAEKMSWLGIDPHSIRHILITHQDTDHVGAVEADSPGLFRDAKLYIGEIENRYLTGEVRRKVIYHLYRLPQVTINNEKVLLTEGQVLDIDGIRIECLLVPGHTWGHMVYLIDDKYLFTGDTIWFDGVAESLRRYRPDVVMVNACAAELLDEGRLIMDDADVAALHAARPEARIIVSHMDTVPHAALTRQDMDQALRRRGIREAVFMPDDGQSADF